MVVMVSPGRLAGVADDIANAAQQLGQAPQLTSDQGFAATGFRESRAVAQGLGLASTYLNQWHQQAVDTMNYRSALVELAGKWFAAHDDATAADLRRLADQALKQSTAPANPPAH